MRRVVAFVLFVTGVVVGAGAGLAPVSATVDPATIFPVTQISASQYHTCAVVSNGTAACWGYGEYGALGAGNNNGSNTPVAVTGGALANKTITQIDSAMFHTCAVVSDGTVACWGLNQYGQLGTGISNNSNTPVAITGGALANKSVTQITTGAEHTCALISDGTVTCWGRNNGGQLGTGDNTDTNTPVAITGGALAGKTVTQITAGHSSTCAVVSDGTVACWGGMDSNTPVAVTGGALAGETVTKITAGYAHMCALISDGTVACWGQNIEGQLGTGDNTNANTPVAITGGALTNKTVTSISAGAYHSCAVISNGTGACWGFNQSGQLGTGDTSDINTPVAITGGALTNKTITQIAGGYNYTCALISDGTATCWGDNSGGVLGTGNEVDSTIPIAVTGGTLANKTATQVTAGSQHTCALISDGSIVCSGWNLYGQLGTGDNTSTTTPVPINGGALTNKTVTQINAGIYHTCALISDGTVACWGENNDGQLGIGDNIDRNVPVAVTGGALENKTITQIAAGNNHTCALISDGTIACWGRNNFGQLGTGNYNDSNIPVAVTGGALANKTVAEITTSFSNTCALISDGTVACWGYNGFGQLGTGDTSDSNTPVAVTGGALAGTTVTKITAGTYFTCAVISGGTLACWGYNANGQLGTGDNTSTTTPVSINGGALTNKTVTHIAAGANHMCAVIAGGSVACWGYNDVGQLGTGNLNGSNTPVAVTGGALTNNTVTHIAAGNTNTCAMISNGNVACSGYNGSGQIGTSDPITFATNPVIMVLPTQATNTSAPSVSGVTRTGQTLTASDGTWDGAPTPEFTYQWYACTALVASATQAIPGTCTTTSGTNSTLPLTPAHAGKYIAVEVTGTSTGTDPVSWLSASTTSRVKMQASATVKPTITGRATVGRTLTANEGQWAGFPTPTYRYKWYSCTSKATRPDPRIPGKCRLIKGATARTFKLTATQKGKYIAVRVTATSAGTLGTSWLSKTTTTKVS